MLHHLVGRITRIMVTVADISQRMNCKGPNPPSSPNPPWYHPKSTTGSFAGSSSAKTSRQNPGPDSQVLRSTSCRRIRQRGVYTSAVELEDRSQSTTNWGYTIEIRHRDTVPLSPRIIGKPEELVTRPGNLLIPSNVDPAISMELRHLEWSHNGARIVFVAPSRAGRHTYSVLWAVCCTSWLDRFAGS
jgi:hypothetical protein